MQQETIQRPRGMRVFITIWLGQVGSLVGSNLSSFALGIVVYRLTGSVMAYGLFWVFLTLPGILIAPLAGALVDRWDRRLVMIVSDLGAAVGPLTAALLLFSGRLEVWHIYVVMAISSLTGAFQRPAFSSSVPMLVPKEQLGRANGLVQTGFAICQIVAPALSGALMMLIPVYGIFLIDLTTLVIAVTIMLLVRIPRPAATGEAGRGVLWREMLYGWKYLAAGPGLMGLLILTALSTFSVGIVSVLFIPLTLSVTSTAVSGSILSVGGIGMLVGSVLLSVWGGPKRRVYGVLGFLLLQGLAIAVGGIRPLVPLFFVAAFCYFFAVPLADGCTQAILQCKVAPSVQGRAFAFYNVAWTGMMPLAAVIVGPLADRVFEPLMAVDGPMTGTVLGRLIEVGEGRGMGLMFVLSGVLLMLVTVGAYLYPHIRRVDVELPDALDEA